jgi:hypothetical protein
MSDFERRSESTARGEEKDAVSMTNSEKRRESDMDIDAATSVALESIEGSRRGVQTKKEEDDTTAANLAKTKSLRSIHSHRSYAASDGYTCFPQEDARPNFPPGGSPEDAFIVQWDGDADPLNPRSMSKLRRWVIALIISSSSLCV